MKSIINQLPGFFCGIIAMGAAILFIAFATKEEPQEEEPAAYDYIIDLQTSEDGCASISVTTDYHCTYIIHPDSLEEFIIKDNL